MRQRFQRRLHQRLLATAVLVGLSSALAGCGGGLSGWDPTDMLDFLDTKKKLPGDRRPVFPEGVPGLEQGVPKDLYKGAQQDAAVSEPVAPPPEAAPKRGAKKSRGQSVAARPVPAAPEAAPSGEPDAVVEDGSTAAAPPAPKPAKTARRRTTAPPPAAAEAPAVQPAAPAAQPQQAASPFPAPLPSGSFTR